MSERFKKYGGLTKPGTTEIDETVQAYLKVVNDNTVRAERQRRAVEHQRMAGIRKKRKTPNKK
jgi:hypothetical protein